MKILIREAKRILPDIPHVAVFDTAFHQTLPPGVTAMVVPTNEEEIIALDTLNIARAVISGDARPSMN